MCSGRYKGEPPEAAEDTSSAGQPMGAAGAAGAAGANTTNQTTVVAGRRLMARGAWRSRSPNHGDRGAAPLMGYCFLQYRAKSELHSSTQVRSAGSAKCRFTNDSTSWNSSSLMIRPLETTCSTDRASSATWLWPQRLFNSALSSSENVSRILVLISFSRRLSFLSSPAFAYSVRFCLIRVRTDESRARSAIKAKNNSNFPANSSASWLMIPAYLPGAMNTPHIARDAAR